MSTQQQINGFLKKLSPSSNEFQGTDARSLQVSLVNHLEFSLAKDEYSATQRDLFKSLAFTVKDRLIERWIETQQSYYRHDAKRIYYLSMEFLPGRLLGNALHNLGIYDTMKTASSELGVDLEALIELEEDPGLGNGGLGRLAACFLDSMATLELPGYGYGIRYDYGIFTQKLQNGYQIETPDSWLRYGNPWEIERPEYIYMIKFYGRVNQTRGSGGEIAAEWTDTEDVIAMAYDTPIPGYRNNTVNNLRLWAAKGTREFNLDYFNHGDYDRAVEDKISSEVISKVLYPRDDINVGRELRLKQEYFLVSATLQDIIRRYKKTHPDSFEEFPDKVTVQLNDTHPVLAIPELMRILVDIEHVDWNMAWDITVRTFGYTNHTVLPEALEKWRVELLEYVLPRHIQIIYEINRRFLDWIKTEYPDDTDLPRRVSIIEESPERNVRMAHLGIIGSRSVNGVAELHTRILRENLFHDFYDLWPDKFNCKTNGITPRRWLLLSNPQLAELISGQIGDGWVKDLTQLEKLAAVADNRRFQERWRSVKRENKVALSDYIHRLTGIPVDPDSMFDCQIKRIHEYKRQLLNIMHVIYRYNQLKAGSLTKAVPRTVVFAGKAAPAYTMAKLIIKLITSVGDLINNDKDTADRLKVVFLPNYSVSQAQIIIPAADLSEQISTAGMEASGTGNMKFALNGALTIGTLDGANIEIRDQVGEENMFIFGLLADQVREKRRQGYDPEKFYSENESLRQVINMIRDGLFSPSDPELFLPIIDSLISVGDNYMLLADFESYINTQRQVDRIFAQTSQWTRMSILNVANMGAFSSDRTIRSYNSDIWKSEPVPIKLK